MTVTPIDPYGTNIFAHDPHREGPNARRPRSRDVAVEYGMVLEDVTTGWVGAVTRVEKSAGVYLIELEDRHGRTRSFPLGPGFWLDGEPINACPPRPRSTPSDHLAATTPMGRRVTNSGSIAVPHAPARIAKASRIWVEGRHDAELVEHVWGEDLGLEGIVVELLEGVDNLEEILEEFTPTTSARAGILIDHAVAGSKESRIADAVMRRWGESVLVVGHPFVDIWQAVKPERLGLTKWPDIPRGTDIKVGTLTHLGWPHDTQADIARGWKRILATVRTYRDLEPALLGRVEELIDFVTAPGTQ
ncbi:DUF3097 domain-containing protein [Schaalia sp. ZJ1691]|uniref:DUF3097 domain-containing protein n=1 Tax=Schaalia sp. ZJ1691 TaxID=2709404 RepID=UPI0013EAB0D1|nr:DUF3097 domain-containing protein [Schaalia sp. ZJ1691]